MKEGVFSFTGTVKELLLVLDVWVATEPKE